MGDDALIPLSALPGDVRRLPLALKLALYLPANLRPQLAVVPILEYDQDKADELVDQFKCRRLAMYIIDQSSCLVEFGALDQFEGQVGHTLEAVGGHLDGPEHGLGGLV
ncbi:MAG: hypothetical protein ACOC5K_04865, partial [Chloroflexota bacterium]